jgi:hypothetical protein
VLRLRDVVRLRVDSYDLDRHVRAGVFVQHENCSNTIYRRDVNP